jgi:glycosyltransferase involved in cell wall biosynthesis
MKVAFVAGIVTPYTHRAFELLGRRMDGTLHVYACSDMEPGRQWTLPPAVHYRRCTLAGLRIHRSYLSHIYFNPGIIRVLVTNRFDIILVAGFSPTMLVAACLGFVTATPVILGTDAQPETDPGQWSLVHRIARRMIVPRCSCGIGASRGTLQVLERYGLPPDRGVVVPLVPGWDFTGTPTPFEVRPFDLMFCGHLDDDRKGLLFFLDVVARCVDRGYRPRVRITGDGPLRPTAEERLRDLGICAHFDGYLAQDALGDAYSSAKLFLFPSRGDPWGLVANEAMQCGTPVIVSPHARVAHELVVPSNAGAMLELSTESWSDAVLGFLTDRLRWNAAHVAALRARRSFSVEATADGFLRAFAEAMSVPCHPAPLRES